MRLAGQLSIILVALVPLAAVAEEVDLRAAAHAGHAQEANIDRAVLLPTAETQPQGSFTASDYEFFMFGLTYGVTDDLQVGALVPLPIFGEATPVANVATLSAKVRVLGEGRFHLAAQGTAGAYSSDSLFREDQTPIYSLGGIGSLCLDARCESLLSANAAWMATGTGPPTLEGSQLLLGASWVQALHPNIKLLVEAIGFLNNERTGAELSRGMLVNYGFRTNLRQVAFDVGFLKPIDLDDPMNEEGPRQPFPLGAPFVAFTYRML